MALQLGYFQFLRYIKQTVKKISLSLNFLRRFRVFVFIFGALLCSNRRT